MLATGALTVVVLVSTCFVCDAAAGVGGKQFPRNGYPSTPGFRGAFPGVRGDEDSQNKGTANNFLWSLKGRNRSPFARAQDWTGAGRRDTQQEDRVPISGSPGFGQGSRRYRRDFSGYGYRGIYPGAPAWGQGYGFGAPVGDYGQDFGSVSDNWRST